MSSTYSYNYRRLVYCIILNMLMIAIISAMAMASDGYIAYRSNTGSGLNNPKIRFWDSAGSGTWGNEIELASAGSPIRHAVIKKSPVSSKIILITYSDDGGLDAYACEYNCTNPASWTLSSNIVTLTIGNQRRFDFEYESATGDAVLVYSVVNANTAIDLAYRVLPDASLDFSAAIQQSLDDTGHATDLTYTWIAADRDPVADSEEIIFAGFDGSSSDINAWVWNGSTFGNQAQITAAATATGGYEAISVKYSADGTDAMVIGGDGAAGNIAYNYWTGAGWAGALTFDVDAADNNDVQWLTLKADPSTDDLQGVVVDSGSDLSTIYWSGATWATTTNIDTGVDIATARCADFSWLPTGGAGRLVWDTDAALTTVSQRPCTPQCTGVTTTVATYAGTGSWVALYRNPTAAETVDFLGFRLNNAFALGSLYFNGATYTNYGDSSITASTTVATYESFTMAFDTDTMPPRITYNSPADGTVQQETYAFVNISSNEVLSSATLEWAGVNESLTGSLRNWYVNKTGLAQGTYQYKVYTYDVSNNLNMTSARNVTVNFPPNITLISPQNDTTNTSSSIFFQYSVNDTLDTVSRCSLMIDTVRVQNTTSSPVPEGVTLNFTHSLTAGQHNWSIWCNDSNNFNTTSGQRSINIYLGPVINQLVVDDGLDPAGEIILAPGLARTVYCNVTASHPGGVAQLRNASARFYYHLNKSSDPDSDAVHYTNSSCVLSDSQPANRTYSCAFNVYYYANNGSWICNATVFDNLGISSHYNISTLIQPLYALNITDGLDFGDVETNSESPIITANITNIGNMPINVTLLGYGINYGDGIGMNCSDSSIVNLSAIKFSINPLYTYAQKTALESAAQQIGLRMLKQTGPSNVVNSTYWQIVPPVGSAGKMCTGYVVFSAES